MTRAAPSPRTEIALVAMVALAIGLAFLGMRGLWEPGEGWVAVAVEGRLRGEALTPPASLLQVIEVELATLGRRLIGRSEFALRLGHGLAVLVVALLVGRISGLRGALVWLFGPPVLLFQGAVGWSAPLLGWPPTPWPAFVGFGLVAWLGLALAVPRFWRGGRLAPITRAIFGVLALLVLGARLTLATLPTDRDARLLNLSLPDERKAIVVSLDDREHLALEWYLKTPIVRAEWDTFVGGQAPGRVGLAQVLEGTVPRGSPPVLFLLPAPDVPRLTRELQAVNLTITDRRSVGRVGSILAFRVVGPGSLR